MSHTLDEIKLLIPELWKEPWDEHIAAAENIDREFLRVQARYAHLLRQLSSVPVTPAKLGFLSLWSRLFGSLAGSVGTTRWKSRFALNVHSRIALEAFLHLQAVLLPVLEPDGSDKEEEGNRVRDRLGAYVAWTLHTDCRLYRDLLSEQKLDAAYSPELERKMAQELSATGETWEKLTHQRFEIVSDEEAAFDKARGKQSLQDRLDRNEHWLRDDRLSTWQERLRVQEEKQPNRTVTLFALLGLKNSVKSFAEYRGGLLGYFDYSRTSGYIHGSSFESCMAIGGVAIAPDYADLADEFADCAKGILRRTGLSALLLSLMANRLDMLT